MAWLANSDEEDRLSSLPDGVICHILSFLPTKDSIKTNILSTRWHGLSSLVPIFHFESSSDITVQSFVRCINRAMSFLVVSRLMKFTLEISNWEHIPAHFNIGSWIEAAAHRGAKEIDIFVHLNEHLGTTGNLFSSRTLTNLRLEGKFNVVLQPFACASNLRNCVLYNVSFSQASAQRLLRSCPVLEELELYACSVGEGAEFLDISSPSLKTLSICQPERNYGIRFNTPNLLIFKYTHISQYSNVLSGLGSLESVVDACIYYEWIASAQDNFNVADLICALRHVQKLCLSSETLEAFRRTDQSFPRFNTLASLSFTPLSGGASTLLQSLLDNTPQVEFLSFYQGTEEIADFQEVYWLPDHAPACVAEHLKEVEFRYFFGFNYDCMMIKYLLKHAKNLKMMKIRCEFIWDEQFEISSEDCQIVFHSDGIERYIS